MMLRESPKFKEAFIPIPGLIVISPTGYGTRRNSVNGLRSLVGTWSVLAGTAASNDLRTEARTCRPATSSRIRSFIVTPLWRGLGAGSSISGCRQSRPLALTFLGYSQHDVAANDGNRNIALSVRAGKDDHHATKKRHHSARGATTIMSTRSISETVSSFHRSLFLSLRRNSNCQRLSGGFLSDAGSEASRASDVQYSCRSPHSLQFTVTLSCGSCAKLSSSVRTPDEISRPVFGHV